MTTKPPAHRRLALLVICTICATPAAAAAEAATARILDRDLVGLAKELNASYRSVDAANRKILDSWADITKRAKPDPEWEEATSQLGYWASEVSDRVANPTFLIAGSLYLLGHVPAAERAKLVGVLQGQCATLNAGSMALANVRLLWGYAEKHDRVLDRPEWREPLRNVIAARTEALRVGEQLAVVCDQFMKVR